MKTAISVDDNLLHDADRTAQEMRISRSRLFSIAMERYLRERRRADLLERLNKVYSRGLLPEERQVLAGMKRRFHATIKDPW